MIIIVPKVSSFLQMKVQAQSYLMHTTTCKEPQQSLLLLQGQLGVGAKPARAEKLDRNNTTTSELIPRSSYWLRKEKQKQKGFHQTSSSTKNKKAPPEISNRWSMMPWIRSARSLSLQLIKTPFNSMLAFKTSFAISINGALLLLCKDGVRKRVSELEKPTMARKRNNQNFKPAIVKYVKAAGLTKDFGV